jgi:hypothetical protein
MMKLLLLAEGFDRRHAELRDGGPVLVRPRRGGEAGGYVPRVQPSRDAVYQPKAAVHIVGTAALTD